MSLIDIIYIANVNLFLPTIVNFGCIYFILIIIAVASISHLIV